MCKNKYVPISSIPLLLSYSHLWPSLSLHWRKFSHVQKDQNKCINISSNNPCSIRYVNSPECTTLPLMLHFWAHYYNPEPELRAFWRDSVTKLYTGRVCYHFPIQPLSLPIPPDISLPAAPTNPRFSFHDKFQRSHSRSVSLPKIKVWNFFRSPGELDSELL